MSFYDYLSAKAVSLCAAGIGAAYLILVSFMCGIPKRLIIMLLVCAGVGAAVWLFVGWRITDRRLRTLKRRIDGLSEKYLIGETLDRPKNPIELEYYLLMKEISRSAIGAVEQARADKQDYCDYVESWVHEIKTPLTACSLILSNSSDPAKLRRELRRELRRADNLTETILTYAKLRTAEKDTQITRVGLRRVCDQAVQEEMELLIAAGISVSIDGDCEVYTDPKLFVFILKQLLINCAKYCRGCQIKLVIANGSLTFEDNGIGIPAHELSRVTERGFTGAAGRSLGQSTGMGLYIVGELCKKLNIGLAISSKEGRFTRFEFGFSAPTLQKCQTSGRER